MTKATRTRSGSICRYSPIPPQTPPMTRLVRLRSRRADMVYSPSVAAFVDRREEHRGKRRERDARTGERCAELDEARDGRLDGGDARAQDGGARSRRTEGVDRQPADRDLDREAEADQGGRSRRPRIRRDPRLTLGRRHDRRDVEPRRTLIGVERERPAQPRLGERLHQLHVLHTPDVPSSLRRSRRARSSWTPTVEVLRPVMEATSSSERSLKYRSTTTTR